ncbi:MAG: hypothetical protein MAG451_02497 [Anaerolineales bacterium]|nr:hypothetical protein [Anaerolineales bacterium]
MLSNQVKRRIAYTVLMFVFAALARHLVDRWFPEERET